MADAHSTERPVADIALLLEGTYPYVRGGVSAWVHQIITGLPEYTFSLVFLGGVRENYQGLQYTLPDNVIHFEDHFIMESHKDPKVKPRKGNSKIFEKVRQLHEGFKKEDIDPALMKQVFKNLGSGKKLSKADFLYSEAAWNFITEDYERYSTDPSFVDYFWTVRIMHAPLFLLADIAENLPPARVFHAVSTGYAGLLGTLLSQRRARPYILTEHGIYTKERKIDLMQAKWIKTNDEELDNASEEGGYLRRLWIRFFEVLGQMAYLQANPIISLFEGNRQRQIRDGAPAEKCHVIPNGIEVERFTPLLAKRPSHIPPIIGLVGRVVPIKDIKTFIRAMREVCNVMEDAEGWIVGPEEEDAEYAQECRELVFALGLEGKVKFLGFQSVDTIYPKLGLMALTSISEAQPLVVLEGFAAGIPSVTTDVGNCREMIEGKDEEDRALGQAGRVVPIADPVATGQAMLALLQDEQQWHAAQQAGLKRVKKYYRLDQMFDRYRLIYNRALETSPWQE